MMSIFDLVQDIFDENASEKRERTRDNNKRAKSIVSDAKEKFRNSRNSLDNAANKTKETLKQYNTEKSSLLKNINEKVKTTQTKFNNFNIDSKIRVPSINCPNDFALHAQHATSMATAPDFVHASQCFPIFDTSSLLSDFFMSTEDDYDASKENLENAREYYREIKYECEKMSAIETKFNIICSQADAEIKVLKNLISKLILITDELNLAMEKKVFNCEEATRLKGIHTIAATIYDFVSKKFFDNDLTITLEYKKAYSQICDIENMLTKSPTLKEIDNHALLNICGKDYGKHW